MNKTWLDVVKEFNTTPFLFVGSGISRRYMGLPDWKSLLKHFSDRLSDDHLKFVGMQIEAKDDLGVAGGNLQKEFDARWISDPAFRTNEDWIKKQSPRSLFAVQSRGRVVFKEHSSPANRIFPRN